MNKYVYLGPARPFGLPLMPNAILAGKAEDVFPEAQPFFGEHKSFRRLFVPVAELASARAAMATPGSPLALYRDEIKAASDAFKKEVA